MTTTTPRTITYAAIPSRRSPHRSQWDLSLHYARVLCEAWGVGSRISKEVRETGADGTIHLYSDGVWELRRNGWWNLDSPWKRRPRVRREHWV